MIDITQAQLDAFKSSNQKNLILEFTDGTTASLDNNSIRTESMVLDQTLCDEETLVFGKCSANSFTVQVKATNIRYKGKTFVAKLKCNNQTLQLGKFTVYSDKINDDGLYRELICYDAMYTATDVDVTSWYNGLTFPITMANFRTSLINHLGWEQETQTLCNDSMTILKTVDVVQVSAVTMLEYICELNACFGKIDNLGKFKYVELDDVREALYPSDELYPSEDLYPRTDASDTLTQNDISMQSLTYEEYTCQPITQVKIRETIDDLGTTVGEEGNLYVIEGNILCYGKTSTELQTIANNFLALAELTWYQPFTLGCKGRAWLEVGDFIKVVGNKSVIRSVILHRTLTGISALKDSYSSQGMETYPLNSTSIQTQIEQLRGASVKVTKEVNGLSVEVENLAEETDSKLEVLESQISAKVSKGDLDAEVEILEGQINTKVSEGDVVSEINQSSDVIRLKSNRLVVESTNFSLDRSGNVEMTGDVKASSLMYNKSISMVFDDAYFDTSHETEVIGLAFVGASGGIYRYNLAIGTNSEHMIGSAKQLLDTVEILGNLKVDGYIENGYESLGSGWYKKRLSATQYEYIFRDNIGSGSYSAYGNMYVRTYSLSFPESISNLIEFNANIFGTYGLFTVSMNDWSSSGAKLYIGSAKTETVAISLNYRMIATK